MNDPLLLFIKWLKVGAVQVHNSSPSNFKNAREGEKLHNNTS